MEQKLKKCSGLLNAYGYGCGEMSVHKKFGLGECCYNNWLFNTDKGRAYLKKIELKRSKPKKYWSKNKEENYKEKLQININRIAKLIDKGNPCLIDGKTIDCQAGHVISIGSNDTLRFNLHNIHRQSKISNFSQTDDLKLREAIAKEYGQEYMNFIQQLRQVKPVNLSSVEIKELILVCDDIYNALQSNIQKVPIYRIKIRNEVNKTLGIYPPEFCEFKTN